MQPIPKRNIRFFLIVLLSSFFAPSFTRAASVIQSSDTANYFRVIWGLLVVLGIILILYGLLRKRFSLLSAGTSHDIQVVELKPLMGKKALCLINVKGQEHLLGISGDRITHIAAITPQPESSFAEVLQATGVPSQS
ncbi:MAG: flagellar biosynthetic protein FliO [Desulforhopalus sp.]